MKKYGFLSALSFICLSVSWAQTVLPAGPGWHLSTSDEQQVALVSQIIQNQTPGSSSERTPASSSGTVAMAAMELSGTMAITTSGNEADEITPEIQELARGLENDPLRIYNYCKNHIEYEHYFGCKKGATMTLLEGKGNSFDTAALMVSLLRAAGIEATYRYGAGWYYDWEIEEWWGLSSYYDSSALPFPHLTDTEFRTTYGLAGDPRDTRTLRFNADKILFCINRGFPAIYCDYWGENFYVPQVWVGFTYGGTSYNVDPSQKTLSDAPSSPMELATATGYNRTAFLNAAGGSTGSAYVQNLSESSISNQLVTYTANLTASIRTNHYNDTVQDVLGIRKPVEQHYSSLSEIPGVYYATPAWLSSVQEWTEIPDAWMSTLTIKLGEYDYGSKNFTRTDFTGTLKLPELKGRKLALTFSGNTGTLSLDDTPWTNVTVSAADVDMELFVNHPHGDYDYLTGVFTDDGSHDQSEVKAYRKNDSYAYAILYGYAPSGKLIRKRQEVLDSYKRDGLSDTSKEVVTEVLNIMGLNWLLQTELGNRIVTSQFNVSPLNHHRLGRMAQEEGFYVDVGLQYSGDRSYCSDLPAATTAFQFDSLFASALEHGLIEQMQGAGNKAASTVKILQLANAQNMRVYRATPSNWSSVRSTLSGNGYAASTLNSIEEYITADSAEVLLPANEDVTLDQWTGTGYAVAAKTVAGMIISGGYNGGYLSEPAYVDPAPVISYSYSDPGYWDTGSSGIINANTPVTTTVYYGADPVDMASGAFTYSKTDIALGKAAPSGLAFTRFYNSNRRYDDTPGLGYGWTHSLNVTITERSAVKSGLGETTPYQMAPYATAITVAKDLYENSTTAKEWQTAALVVKWGIDQLLNKGVSVTLGSRTLEFVQMPDGSYEAPAGIAMELSKVNGNYQLKERHGSTYTFNSDLKLATVTDLNGKTLTLSYNGGKQLTTVTDCYNRTLTLTWNSGKITRVADSTGRDVDFSYTSDNLTTVTDLDSHDWTFVYDSEHRITELQDPESQVITHNVYDSRSRVSEQYSEGDTNKTWNLYYTGYENIQEDPEAGQTLYAYDNKGRCVGVEDALGNRVKKVYDGQDHLVENILPANVLSNGNYYAKYNLYDKDHNLWAVMDEYYNILVNEYDSQNRLIGAGDYLGNEVTYSYNAADQVTSITDGRGMLVQTNTYHANGNLATTADIDGNTTSYTYDSWGNVSRIDYPDTSYETFTYNARGDLLSHTDAEGNTTGFTYNNRRQLLVTTFADTSTQTNTFDSCGNLVSSTDNNGNTTSFTYSPTKKKLTTTLPAIAAGTPVLQNSFDSREWLASSSRPLSGTNSFAYDAAGRIITATDPLGRNTHSAYDENGNLVGSINSANETNWYGYGFKNELLRRWDPLDQIIDYSYDANGNQTNLVNRRIQSYTSTYDPDNRLLTSTTPLGHTVSNVWNNRGLLESVRKASGQTTGFTYDSMGRIQTQTDAVGTVTFGYNANGNILSVTEGTNVISRGYDNRNQIVSYTNAAGQVIGYQHDNNGNLTRLTYPGGKTVDYTYNAHNQLKTVTDWGSRTTTYAYDLRGRITSITRPNGTVREIQYDSADQVLRVQERKANGSLFTHQEFQYDAAGRMDSEFIAPVPQGYSLPANTITYDVDNRIASFNGLTVVHDDDGNMTSGPLATNTLETYSYDARNRLTSVGGITYTYDAEDHRIAQTDTNGTTRYTINPNAALSQVLMRQKPDGTTTYYVYGMGLLYEVDEQENTLTYHYDYRGSTRFLTADDGNTVTDVVEYSPFGTITHRTGATDTPFLFNGKYGVQTDANGLLCMRARYYSTNLRRFINADPIGFAGGMNWYAYVNGNPVFQVDPDGEFAWILAGAAIGALIDGGIDLAMQIHSGGEINWGQVGASAARGAVVGAVSSIAGPLGGTIAKGAGGLATGIGAKAISVGISSAGSAAGQVGYNALMGNELSDGVGTAAALGAAGQGVANVFPVKGVSTMAQAKYFAPKSLSSMFATPNSQLLSASLITSSAVGGGAYFFPQGESSFQTVTPTTGYQGVSNGSFK